MRFDAACRIATHQSVCRQVDTSRPRDLGRTREHPRTVNVRLRWVWAKGPCRVISRKCPDPVFQEKDTKR